jgi:hypothetical protein
MSSNSVLLTLDLASEEALRIVAQRLSRAGLRPLRTFDLQGARLAAGDCLCPRHGTAACDCRLVVLLVYGGGSTPATLLLHSNDGRTWLSMIDNPSQAPDAGLALHIGRALRNNTSEEGL